MRLWGKVAQVNLKSVQREFFDLNCEFKQNVTPVPAILVDYGDGFAHTFGDCSFGYDGKGTLDCTIEVTDPAVLDERLLETGQYAIELGYEALETTLSHEGTNVKKARIHCVKLIEAAKAKWPGLGIVKRLA